jgi:hypothetical protein
MCSSFYHSKGILLASRNNVCYEMKSQNFIAQQKGMIKLIPLGRIEQYIIDIIKKRGKLDRCRLFCLDQDLQD